MLDKITWLGGNIASYGISAEDALSTDGTEDAN